jgi:hypothetical protein
MKTKHQTDRTSAEQQAAATYEQQQLASGQRDMDLGMAEDGMNARLQQAEVRDEQQLVEEQHNMDLDEPRSEGHNMELERETALEQQLPGIFSSQRSKTSVLNTC